MGSNRSVKVGLLVAAGCLVVAGLAYLGLSAKGDEAPTTPKGSVYYQGQMAADIESASHDPRKHGKPARGR